MRKSLFSDSYPWNMEVPFKCFFQYFKNILERIFGNFSEEANPVGFIRKGRAPACGIQNNWGYETRASKLQIINYHCTKNEVFH